MRIIHIIRDLDVASGGPSRSLPALAEATKETCANLEVDVVFQYRGRKATVDVSSLASVHYHALEGSPSARLTKLMQWLRKQNRRCAIDVIHLHGLWSPSIHLAARFSRGAGIPYVVSPRGMLSDWCIGSKSLRKRIAWAGYQRKDLQRSSCIHATSDAEAFDIRSKGFVDGVEVIPHGCDLPPPVILPGQSDQSTSVDTCPTRVAVTMCRLHPVKGLEDLVEAWGTVRPENWRLLIVGPDSNNYRQVLHKQIERRNLVDTIEIRPAVNPPEKWRLLDQADLYVSASHSENFGMSIAEAMASGTPVITTQSTPWSILSEADCGWWVPVGIDGLSAAINEATTTKNSDLSSMGHRCASLIEAEYSWRSVSEKMTSLYRSIAASKTTTKNSIVPNAQSSHSLHPF